MSICENEVAEITEAFINRNHRVFQIYWLDKTLEGHIAKLLEFYDPPVGAKIVDLGCGIGEVARLMKQKRPDLDFVLLNKSASQLALCPDEFEKVEANFHNLPLDQASADAVMINYALGYSNPQYLINEIAWLLKENGELYIYDIASFRSKNIEVFNYRVFSFKEIIKVVFSEGFFLVRSHQNPPYYHEHFLDVVDQKTFVRLFSDVYPFIAKFVIHAH